MYESLGSRQSFLSKSKIHFSVRDPASEVGKVRGDDVELDIESVLPEWSLTTLVTRNRQREIFEHFLCAVNVSRECMSNAWVSRRSFRLLHAGQWEMGLLLVSSPNQV